MFSSDATYAFFSSQGVIKNTSFTTGIWGPPSAPILQFPDENPSNQNVVFEWLPPLTVYFSPVTYILEIYDANPEIVSVNTIFSQSGIVETRHPRTGGINLITGNYWWRAKTVDRMGNSSSWSGIRKLVIDKTPPISTIKIGNTPPRRMDEQINDGSFEKYINQLDGLDFSFAGEVNSWKNEDGYLAQAFQGNRMLRLGSPATQIEGGDWSNNRLSYVFDNNSKTISFYYNFFSADEYPFDDPGFVFKLNNTPVFQMGAGDISGTGLVKSTGWKQFVYDIADISGEIKLDFFAGNTEDNFRQSWVYLDEIHTGKTVVNGETKFILEADDVTAVKKYCFDSCGAATENEYTNPFSAASLSNGEHIIYFYSRDSLGNEESKQMRQIFLDKEVPSRVTDLSSKLITTDTGILVFTAPSDAPDSKKVSGYEIKLSKMALADSASPDEKNSWWDSENLLENNMVPGNPSVLEEFKINDLESNTTYYVILKSFDGANNYSELSNVLSFKTRLKTGDILISEVLYDALDAPEATYEWVQLYNITNESIDLQNWYLLDNSSKHNIINASLPGRNYFLLTPSTLNFQNKYPFYRGMIFQVADGIFGNGLANGGDFIKLFDSSNVAWDEVGWEDNVIWVNCQLAAGPGKSIIRKNLTTDTNTESDWIVNQNPLLPLGSL